MSPEYVRALEEQAISYLRVWRRFLTNVAQRWEEPGYEIRFEEIRDTLFSMEPLLEVRAFKRSETVDRTSRYEVERDLELDLLAKAIERLRIAAEPVLQDRAADKEAQRLRSMFRVLEAG